MRRTRVAAVALAALAAAACTAGPTTAPSPRLHGIEVRATPGGGTLPDLAITGELIAVYPDTVFLLAGGGGLYPLPLRDLQLVPTEPRGGLRPFAWAGIGGVVTGLGLTVACASVDDAEGCGVVLPMMVLLWLVVGGLAHLAAGNDEAQPLDNDPAALRLFVRFPAGLPPGYREAHSPGGAPR